MSDSDPRAFSPILAFTWTDAIDWENSASAITESLPNFSSPAAPRPMPSAPAARPIFENVDDARSRAMMS